MVVAVAVAVVGVAGYAVVLARGAIGCGFGFAGLEVAKGRWSTTMGWTSLMWSCDCGWVDVCACACVGTVRYHPCCHFHRSCSDIVPGTPVVRYRSRSRHRSLCRIQRVAAPMPRPNCGCSVSEICGA